MSKVSNPFLQTIGLTRNEADLYELLLKMGEVPVWRIQKEVDLKRPTIYLTLKNLEKKELVAARDINKVIHFRPEPPTKLLVLAEQQYNELDRAKKDLQIVLPQLTSSYIMAVEKPVVRILEGVDGLKEIYEDTLKEGKEIYAAVLPVEVEPKLLRYLKNSYRVRRAKMGIHAYVLASSNEFVEDYRSGDEKFARTTRIVPREKFLFKHEVDIYGSKVAFIQYHPDHALIGVIINHPQIASTMKALFDLAWESAGAYHQQLTYKLQK